MPYNEIKGLEPGYWWEEERFMRRLLWIFTVILFGASLITMAVTGGGQKQPPQDAQQTQAPAEKTTVMISAAGDCTLANDEAAAGEGSFDAEVQAQNNDYSYFLRNVADIFREDQLTMVNFEGTLSTGGSRMDKQFAFRGKPDYVNILTSSSVEAANLANNHSKDYGEQSQQDTIQTLENANILCFNGTKTALTQINGISVGLVGINALNEEQRGKLGEAVASVKEQGAQLILVNIHWGEEKATEPNDLQKQLAHQAVDAGADLVIGHHPHVLQGIEKYNGKYIAYSLGNFCFGGNKNPADKDSMIFRQTFTFENGAVLDDDNVEIIPCVISSETGRNNYQPTPAEGEAKQQIIDKLNGYTQKLGALTLKFR
jgi:poly-gamma-glutamate capsule biosynthesis protein CapA/YwtB (metallophosphatase superfamily)